MGTPALTTRGMKESDMEKIAQLINDIISDPSDNMKKDVKQRIEDLTAEHPLYPELFTW
jgi:glycine hydroxymethyltransferase